MRPARLQRGRDDATDGTTGSAFGSSASRQDSAARSLRDGCQRQGAGRRRPLLRVARGGCTAGRHPVGVDGGGTSRAHGRREGDRVRRQRAYGSRIVPSSALETMQLGGLAGVTALSMGLAKNGASKEPRAPDGRTVSPTPRLKRVSKRQPQPPDATSIRRASAIPRSTAPRALSPVSSLPRLGRARVPPTWRRFARRRCSDAALVLHVFDAWDGIRQSFC